MHALVLPCTLTINMQVTLHELNVVDFFLQLPALVYTSHWAALCICLGTLYSSLILESLYLIITLTLGHLWCAGLNMSTRSAVGIVMVGMWESGLTMMGISSLGLVELPMLTSVGVAMLNKSD
jgi:hypothetical protein